jgi:hypothetical protein
MYVVAFLLLCAFQPNRPLMDEPLNGTSAERGPSSWPVIAAGVAAVAGVGIGAFGLTHASSLQSDIKTLQDQVKAIQNNVPASNATL